MNDGEGSGGGGLQCGEQNQASMMWHERTSLSPWRWSWWVIDEVSGGGGNGPKMDTRNRGRMS